MSKRPSNTSAPDRVGQQILTLRGKKVLLDADLAALYGVSSKRLNEQVRRNAPRFPPDFVFQLTDQELKRLRSQFATSIKQSGRGGRRYLPFAFTEHGALMAANVLNSPYAIEASVYVIRAFVRLRQLLATHKDFANKLDELERTVEALALRHDSFAAVTREQFRQIVAALRQLMTPSEPKRKPIGFVTQQDGKNR